MVHRKTSFEIKCPELLYKASYVVADAGQSSIRDEENLSNSSSAECREYHRQNKCTMKNSWGK